ncbi:TetR/AcrR family transcriptional regulator [Mycobacterium sp. 236(2023)]|uniref:TetR/AcrR family transcriptional regulator n=1 Tax=Mycobacterium sp. 236(2023) TaxID=3038163 RepID=UPI0024151C53|nr:TetR/AcrR family transcriptional regulator [Mycobacterium sp. 236(2023)]MDG4663350.1 TetR/AcrR family transcriptional regulator [Mycobacterium sp. 236(2023)]
MTAPRRPATGAQPRAERTRNAVIDETVRCVLEDGFAPPSVRRITDRAGVTWGVVQYHFGDLDGLLMAVVDTGFLELLASLDGMEPAMDGLDTRERVKFFVNAVWQAFSSPTSRAALEILISTRGARTETLNAHLVDLMAQLTALGRQLGEGLSASHATRVGILIWNTLRGIVAAQMVWPEPMDTSQDLETLVDVVSAYIEVRT